MRFKRPPPVFVVGVQIFVKDFAVFRVGNYLTARVGIP